MRTPISLLAGLALCASCSSSSSSPANDVPTQDRPPPGGAYTGALDDAGPLEDAGVTQDGALQGPDAASSDGGPLAPTGCITTVASGDHVFSCDGFTYDVRLPAACASGGCGIVLDVHGATMNGAIEDANTNLRAIGEREGYVVVQPNAKGKVPLPSWKAVDYDKVWAFFTTARQAYAIDHKRVHLTGFSQGGTMTWALMCAHADEIASAAPSALNGCSAEELAAAKRQVPVLYMHGKVDGIASFSTFAAPQRDAVISAWEMGAPTTIASDANYTWSRFTNAKGTVFEFIVHDYSAASAVLKGHCFPGSTDPDSVPGQLFSFACQPPTAFVWGEAVMAFFEAHPLP